MNTLFRFTAITIIACILLSSCKYNIDIPSDVAVPSKGMGAITVPADFNYQTASSANYFLTLLSSKNEPLSGVVVDLLNKPKAEGGIVLATAVSDRNGKLQGNFTLPTFLSEVVVSPRFVGLEQNARVAISKGSIKAQIGGSNGSQGVISNARIGAEVDTVDIFNESDFSGRTSAIPFKYLGTFSSIGKPNYLSMPNATIDAQFLSSVNASLPESKAVPKYHPAYLKNTVRTTLNIQDQSDVWITFVAEGAGYQNTLGFYTYQTGNPPKTTSDIDSIKIILPNASINGTTGPLIPGNRVKIGRFQKGTTIGFVLIANGFQNGKVTSGYDLIFSDDVLNPATNPELKRQSVVLYDATRNLFLCGFEDIRRDNSGCDNDFNDLVFYASSNPVTGISSQNMLPIDKPIDSDGDGVSDVYDEFPADPTRAFSDPTSSTGTLAYEDLWPAAGDYDLNDLVVDYKMWSVKNAQNLALDVNMEFTFRASGGSYNNGFAVELPVPASVVSAVSGAQITSNYISRTATGVEAGQSNAVVIVTDDVAQVLHRPSGSFVNTELNSTRVLTVKMTLKVTFNTPQNLSLGLSAPYNPFLIVNKKRGYEVHLPGYLPTEKANQTLFYTLNDGTSANKDVYYKTKNNLPFALHLPETFDYPIEKQAVINAYPKFFDWARSGGTLYKDWYQDKTGYRDNTVIFK